MTGPVQGATRKALPQGGVVELHGTVMFLRMSCEDDCVNTAGYSPVNQARRMDDALV